MRRHLSYTAVSEAELADRFDAIHAQVRQGALAREEAVTRYAEAVGAVADNDNGLHETASRERIRAEIDAVFAEAGLAPLAANELEDAPGFFDGAPAPRP